MRFSKTQFAVCALVAAPILVLLASKAKSAAWHECRRGEMPRWVCKIVDEKCRIKDFCPQPPGVSAGGK